MVLFNWRRGEPPTLKNIFIASAAGEAMQAIMSVQAIADRGLQSDRYSEAKGYWKSIEACQVTFITEDDLNKAKKSLSLDFKKMLDNGSHRRNLFIGGLKTKQLEGKTFRIGTAMFRYHKPRPPCGYLEKIEGKGLCKALANNSGACIRVVTSGILSVGDVVEIINENN